MIQTRTHKWQKVVTWQQLTSTLHVAHPVSSLLYPDLKYWLYTMGPYSNKDIMYSIIVITLELCLPPCLCLSHTYTVLHTHTVTPQPFIFVLLLFVCLSVFLFYSNLNFPILLDHPFSLISPFIYISLY